MLFGFCREKSKYFESIKELVWCQTPESINKKDDVSVQVMRRFINFFFLQFSRKWIIHIQELNYPAEFELPFDDLPYSILPIFSPDGTNSVIGNPGVVGLLKLHCEVFTADENTT
jgi:hypothetical protein